MKRIGVTFLSFILLTMLIFSVSCADSEEVFDLDFHSEYETDLTGLSFQWGSSWHTQLYPEEGYSEAGDKIRQRIRDIETKYGCTFEVIPWEDGSSRIMQEIAAGRPTIDFLDSHSNQGGIQLYRAGMLVALEDIPNIDYTDDKFAPLRFRQYGIFDGKYYGFYQYAWEFPPEFAGVLMFNADMISSLGVTSPYELQETGNWTWSNYSDYLEQIYSAANSADYPKSFIPHIGTSFAGDALGFMFMNGCKVIETDSSGNYIFGLDNQSGIDALEYLIDLKSRGLYDQAGDSVFINDQNAAIMTAESYYATFFYEGWSYLPAQEYAYGVMMYPLGPDGDSSCVSGFVHNGRRLNWVVSHSANELEDIGTVMDFIFAPLDDSGGWKDFLEHQIFYTKTDFENYCNMLENVNYNYGLPIGDAYSNLETAFAEALQGKRTASEAFSSVRSSINEAIKENINWVFEDFIGD